MSAKRGEIFEYEYRPGEKKYVLIVSADYRQEHKMLNGIFLTDRFHESNVEILCKTPMYANPCAVSVIQQDKIGAWVRIASAIEMDNLDKKIAEALGIDYMMTKQEFVKVPDAETEEEQIKPEAEPVKQNEDMDELISINGTLSEEIIRLMSEVAVLERINDKLLAMVGGKSA